MKSYGENTGTSIESRADFKKTPGGQYKLWDTELRAAQKTLGPWQKQGDKIVSRYLDSKAQSSLEPSFRKASQFRLNLFHSNVNTLYSMLYGNLPTVDVSRRYQDTNDDVGRVAAETMERLLNSEIALNGKELDVVLRAVLLDRLTAGLGTAKVRYGVETEGEGDDEKIVNEFAPIDYVFWGDVLWSWARNWNDVRWVAFRSFLTKDEVKDRFGKKAADGLDFKAQDSKESENASSEDNKKSAWSRAEVWEIWDKAKREVVWYSSGYKKILDTKKDLLGLRNFFPCPSFFLANATSTLYIPTPDFQLSQDLYNEIDTLQTRISIITEAVKVVGVYDSSAEGIKRMFKEGVENELIPVDTWAMFAEKGGLNGQVDWLPLGEIVGALDKLRQIRDETIQLLQQISGMSDVMQGNVSNQYEGTGQTQMKAKFGSIRVQALQDQFAQFASDLMALKAEVIAKHFEKETIAKRSNMQHSLDAELLPQAIDLIKDPEQARLRVAIRPESVAMVDYAQLKAERTDYINALSTFMQSASPLMEADPAAKPFLLELLKWGLAGFKGASEIEGVMDKAIEASQQAAAEPDEGPSPEEQAAQAAAAQEKAKVDGQLQVIQAKGQTDMQVRDHDKQADIETGQILSQFDQQKIGMESQTNIDEMESKGQIDALVEKSKSESNASQQLAGIQAESEKEDSKTAGEIAREENKVRLAIRQKEEEVRLAILLEDHKLANAIKLEEAKLITAKALVKANADTKEKEVKSSNDNV